MDRRALGQAAEELVARCLERSGYRIVARNVRMQRGELDLIAACEGRLWFVEVKCRSRRDVGPPQRAVNQRKRAALYAAAREFVARSGHASDWGFLIASVLPGPDGRKPTISLSHAVIGPASQGPSC